jgi:hypothetical protein
MTGTPAPTTPRGKPTRRRLRRAFRWLVATGLALALLLAATILFITQTGFLGARILPRLSAAADLDVRADAVSVGWDGRLRLERARFRLPALTGPAGEFLSVRTVVVNVDWWQSFRAEPHIRSVQFIEPVLIASQSLDDRSLNIGHLRLPQSAPAAGARLPTITVTDGRIELGEHLGNRYTALKSISIDGRFAPSPDAAADKPSYDFALDELMQGERSAARPAAAPESPGFRISGAYTDAHLALTVENFSLDTWQSESIPTPLRALFRDLNLKGNVPRASFTYTAADGMTARLDLRGVAMSLPLEPEAGPRPGAPVVYGPPPRFMRLYDTEGTITFARDSVLAQVNGRLEDLPYRVTWFHQGLTQNAPFTCDIVSDNFRIDANPALLPYAPPVVAERLRDFSSPTATVTARVTIQRGQPVGEQPGLITVSGSVDLRDGVAAFEGFPYQFRDITGTFRFNNDQIEFRNVVGRSPSGARVQARGVIAPLDEDAQVDVLVEMRGGPIDDAMIQAFGPRHRDLIPALFNQEHYQALREANLIRSSADAQREEDELKALRSTLLTSAAPDRGAPGRIRTLEERAAIPVFDLGGLADVDVNVHRPYGFETPWQTTVDIRLPRAGLLAEVFPFPVEARDLTVHIENNDGRITGGSFRGLDGGTAEVAATFTVPIAGDRPTRTNIAITGSQLPLSPLLIHALPGDDDAEHKRIIRDLNLSGAASGTVRIAGRPGAADDEEEKLGFDADFRIENASLAPAPASPAEALGLAEISARIQMNERRMLLDFTSSAMTPRPVASPGGEPIRPLFGQLRADFLSWGDDASASYSAALNWPDLPLAAPVETLIRALSPAAADQMAGARAQFRPDGLLSAQVAVQSTPDGPAVEVRLDDVRNASFDLFGVRAQLEDVLGAMLVRTSPQIVAAFENFQADLHFAGQFAGTVQLGGAWPLEESAPATALDVALRRAPIESIFLGGLLQKFLPPESNEKLLSYNPRGIIDVFTSLQPGDDGPRWDSIRIEPRTMTIETPGGETRFEHASGVIEVDPSGGGIIRGLSAASEDWSFSADAAWSARHGDGLAIRSEFTLAGRRLSADLRSLLPDELRSVFDDLALEITGPFQLEDGRLNITRDETGRTSAVDFAGAARFRDAALDVGFPLTGAIGRVDARFRRAGPEAPSQFALDVRADSLRAAGVLLNDALATVVSGDRPGEILIRSATADMHEGRVSGSATIAPPQSPPAVSSSAPVYGPPAPDRRGFSAGVQLAGVRFSPLLKEVLAQADPGARHTSTLLTQFPENGDDPLVGVGDAIPDTPAAGDLSRGALDGEFSISGIIGDPRSQRGRGSLRIAGGRVLNLPVVLALLEVSNLALPVNARLDYASADFHVDGGLFVFSDLSVHSTALHIFGSGTMTWPGTLLDLRFDTRSARPIPVLSQIFQGIRNELVTTTVRGRLGEHEVRLQQLPRSRRILGVAARQLPIPAPQPLDDIQRQSQDGRQRGGDFGPGIAPTPRTGPRDSVRRPANPIHDPRPRN